MNYEVEIQNLKARFDSLQESFIQSQINNNDTVNKAYEGYNKANALEPYTDSKTAYYGDTSVTFYDAPQGRASVFIDDMPMDYSVSRIDERLVVSFDQLEVASVQITISIQ
ncbi:MAG: hypothetical protein IKT30_06900 [Bacteroidaceae bacterium]|nr:hypothetical protein [Bacteroidaceae bacterium]